MKVLNYSILKTTRLTLRKPIKEDEMFHFTYQSDPSNFPNVDMATYIDIQEVQDYFNRMCEGIKDGKWLFWIIADKESNEALGTISLWNIDRQQSTGELGYSLYAEARGRGYMGEAIGTVIHYCFNTLDMNVIYAYTHKNNLPSIKVLVKLGFSYDKCVEEEAHCYDGFMSYNVYKLIR